MAIIRDNRKAWFGSALVPGVGTVAGLVESAVGACVLAHLKLNPPKTQYSSDDLLAKKHKYGYLLLSNYNPNIKFTSDKDSNLVFLNASPLEYSLYLGNSLGDFLLNEHWGFFNVNFGFFTDNFTLADPKNVKSFINFIQSINFFISQRNDPKNTYSFFSDQYGPKLLSPNNLNFDKKVQFEIYFLHQLVDKVYESIKNKDFAVEKDLIDKILICIYEHIKSNFANSFAVADIKKNELSRKSLRIPEISNKDFSDKNKLYAGYTVTSHKSTNYKDENLSQTEFAYIIGKKLTNFLLYNEQGFFNCNNKIKNDHPNVSAFYLFKLSIYHFKTESVWGNIRESTYATEQDSPNLPTRHTTDKKTAFAHEFLTRLIKKIGEFEQSGSKITYLNDCTIDIEEVDRALLSLYEEVQAIENKDVAKRHMRGGVIRATWVGNFIIHKQQNQDPYDHWTVSQVFQNDTYDAPQIVYTTNSYTSLP